MAEVIIDKSSIDVKVDNNGVTTFASIISELCLMRIHPFDTGNLIRFLAKEGYNWGVRNDTKRTHE